jgi:hypothetical protein
MTNEASQFLFGANLSGFTVENQIAVSTDINALAASCTFAIAANFADLIPPSLRISSIVAPPNGTIGSFKPPDQAIDFGDGFITARVTTVEVTRSTGDDQAFGATSDATIQDLNIVNILKSDRLTARIEFQRSADGSEAQMHLVGIDFGNLQIAGQTVQPQIDPRFLTENLTFQMVSGGVPADLLHEGSILTSIVTGLVKEDGTRAEGNQIDVPDFGKIIFGELSLSEDNRRLTMIKVVLDGEQQGQASAINICSRDHTIPP